MMNVQRTEGGPVHKATAIRTVNTMPFAATKCHLNFITTFVETAEPVTCRTCNKI